MRVEVNQRDRAVLRGHSTKQRQRDGVIATDRDDAIGVDHECPRSCLNLTDGGQQVERVDRDVAGIHDLLRQPGEDVHERVIRA